MLRKAQNKSTGIVNKNKTRTIAFAAGACLLVASFFVLPRLISFAQESTPDSQSIISLDQQIQDKQQQLEDIQKRITTYQESVKIKQQEALSLQNQLSMLDDQIATTQADIERINIELQQIELEINKLVLQIAEKENELEAKRESLSRYIQVLYQYDQKTVIELFVAHDSFSDFYNQIQYSEQLQQNVKDGLDEVKSLKDELETKRQDQDAKKNELDDLHSSLETTAVTLGQQKTYKEDLLGQTKTNETKFASLLDQANLEQQQASADISNLERQARNELEGEGIDLNQEIATLMWPVSPTKGISAYFHDPTYIFRRYFEHPAIDIPASQGTPIRAAASGYVARAKDAGFGYSYIMLVHNEELSTVYGHVSRIDVREDSYVVRGQQIGLVGGTPGTPGAGNLTTGPHLHFEVRSNGIPVNPLDYLP